MFELILLMAVIVFIGLPFLAVLSACMMASRADQKEEAARGRASSASLAHRSSHPHPRGLAWRLEKPEA